MIDDLPVVAAASESEMEAQLFAQSSSIDSLLSMMRNLEGKNQDIADNDELQVRWLYSLPESCDEGWTC